MLKNFNQLALYTDMVNYLKSAIIMAHEHCTNNKRELENSKKCACFYCFEIYDPKEILEDKDAMWADESTAFCAKCGIDSVIGDASGFPIGDKIFIELMGFVWFNGYARGHRHWEDYYALEEEMEKHIVYDVSD
jgi:hypothetical protein